MRYKLTNYEFNVKAIDEENDRQWIIPFDKANTDYQKYLKWVADGNTPEPAE